MELKRAEDASESPYELAADWLQRLDDPELAEQDLQAWLEWFEASDDNRKAFVREVQCDYYTDAITYTKVTQLETFAGSTGSTGSAGCVTQAPGLEPVEPDEPVEPVEPALRTSFRGLPSCRGT